jgi:O-acetyl-ADP-ribose deacetylase (regulator of RNase III)
MIIEKSGNIFTTNCNTIVNTVNCVGIMGAGIALEFRLRYPKMFERYRILCEQNKFDIGKLWIYNTKEGKRILNFPTKYNWKYPSKIEYIKKGLQKFCDTYQIKGINSIAFPLLGTSHGGLSEENSLSIMKDYLQKCKIPIEIWHYDKDTPDDFYLKLKKIKAYKSLNLIAKESKVSIKSLEKMIYGMEFYEIKNLSGFLSISGIGKKTLEKAFRYVDEKKSLIIY